MTRLTLEDNVMSITTKMAEGNPGAVTVIMDLIINAGAIDPQDALGGLGTVLSLDTLGIYGSNVWVLYKDVCKQDLRTLVMLLRAQQLGYISVSKVQNLSQGDLISDAELKFIDECVCSRLNGFQRYAVEG